MRRIIKLKEVISRTGLSRSAIYNKIKDGSFPKQIPLGDRSVGFVESEVDDWIEWAIESRNEQHSKSEK